MLFIRAPHPLYRRGQVEALALIVTCLNLDVLVVERLLEQVRSSVLDLVLPASHIHIVLVVTLSLTCLGVADLAE